MQNITKQQEMMIKFLNQYEKELCNKLSDACVAFINEKKIPYTIDSELAIATILLRLAIRGFANFVNKFDIIEAVIKFEKINAGLATADFSLEKDLIDSSKKENLN